MSKKLFEAPMNEKAIEIYAYMNRIGGAAATMPADELLVLKKWERENVDGSGRLSTSDWPGWEKYIGPKPVFKDKLTNFSGFIYLMRSGSTNRYKIGKSKNALKRRTTLQTGNPEELSLICTFFTKNAPKQEQKLHEYYLEKKIAGEWFKLTEADVCHFLSLVKQVDGDEANTIACAI